MDLIDEEQAAQAVLIEPALGFIDLVTQILHAGEDGIEAAEVGPRGGRNDSGQGGFADPRRAVKNQVADPIGRDGAPQESTGAQDLLLALKVIEAPGPEAIGQGGVELAQLLTVMAEEIAHAAPDGSQSPSSSG